MAQAQLLSLFSRWMKPVDEFGPALEELKKHLIQLISRVQGLQAIVFTDRDGVPLIKAATDGAPEHALRPGFLATVGMAMSQGNKLGLGKCNKMISSYGNYQVVSFNRHPVTITLVASSSANTGMILNLEEELNTVSQTLRSVVEAS
ncbi:ragulator complex protein LAMTOR3 isoform X1 [Dermacentor albipictus]|uniref:ragulator complex protein LAMTOR3 isoform X1 n=1 Tax=Dermacentor albipictus TaxID=60249 RepID=UPI0031FD421A